MHHIISDMWSFGILGREIAAAYNRPDDGAPRGTSDHLPRLRRVAAAIGSRAARSTRSCATGAAASRERRRWNCPPITRDRASIRSRGIASRAALPARLREGVQRLSTECRATPFMALLAAFNALLYAHSRQTDLAVGVPIANRTRTTTERLIGTFVNTLVHRNELSGDPTFRELLARVRATALEAYAHQDLPFEIAGQGARPAARH